MLHRLLIVFSISLLLVSCSREEIVGEADGRGITRTEFESYLALKNIPANDERRVKAALADYLKRESMASRIEASGTLDPTKLKAELNEFKKQLLISRYFEIFLKQKVDEQAIKNYYTMHAEDYQRDRVKVAHILIRTNKKMSEAEIRAALTKAQEAYSKARTGMNFSDVAEQYSEDRISAKQGGELGWLSKGAIDPVFSEKVFTAKQGDILEPFKTAFGFHVVKILTGPEASQIPFEKVKGDIRYRLRQQTKQAELRRLAGMKEIES